MIISDIEELDGYRDLKVSELDVSPGIGEITLRKLKLAEQQLYTEGVNQSLPFYIVFQHQIEGKNLASLAEPLGLDSGILTHMLDHYGIPRLNNSETRKKMWKDPKFRERQRKTCDAGFRERQSKRMKKLWADPGLRERQSKRMKKLWADPEFREKRIRRMKDRSDILESYDQVSVSEGIESHADLTKQISNETGVDLAYVTGFLEKYLGETHV